MINLALRSIIVLALLFGLVFAIGMGVLTYFGLPSWLALVFALGTLLLQYVFGPFIIEWIYKIRFVEWEQADGDLAVFVKQTCASKNMRMPKCGIIDDGNPNAFTFGHYPGDARLVMTRGLIDMLDADERRAVVGHELGHIAHWDFVVMTVAAGIPLILYVLYTMANGIGRGSRGKGNGSIAAAVALLSYIAYVVSQFIVLLLSRVREYFADQFSAEVTGNPDKLATALVKVAYGLARAPQGTQKKDDAHMVAARSFGIFDPKSASALALASAGQGSFSTQSMEKAMHWDLWNPWAGWFELNSTHPLAAKRIRALETISLSMNRAPSFSFREEQPESYWDEFLVDLFVNFMPLIGFLLGLAVAGIAALLTPLPYVTSIGIGIVLWGLSIFIKRLFTYSPNLETERKVSDLVAEVKVSEVRPIPGKIRGTIIGRGVPGLFYSPDLVMQDESGFIVMQYRQPLEFLQFLFGWLKAEQFIGKTGTAYGWFRRAPAPRFEMRRIEFDDGQKVTSYLYPVTQFFVYALVFIGILAIGAGFFIG